MWFSLARPNWAADLLRSLPPVRVETAGPELVVRFEAPGLDPEGIVVEVTRTAVAVQGRRHARWERRRDGQATIWTEYGAFSRLVPLPEPVNPQGARWRYDGGVLEVRIPRL